MCKKTLYLFVVLGLALSLAGPVLAQSSGDETTSTANVGSTLKTAKDSLKAKLEEQRQKIAEKRQEIENKLNEKKAEVKNKLNEKSAKLVAAYVKRMVNRFDAAIKREENLAGRISARLDAIEKAGKDVASDRKALAEAETKIETAKTKLAEAKTILDAIVVSETPRNEFESSKAKLNEVKDAVNAVHAALVDVINSIKGESGKK